MHVAGETRLRYIQTFLYLSDSTIDWMWTIPARRFERLQLLARQIDLQLCARRINFSSKEQIRDPDKSLKYAALKCEYDSWDPLRWSLSEVSNLRLQIQVVLQTENAW